MRFWKKKEKKFLICKKCACLLKTATNIVTKQQMQNSKVFWSSYNIPKGVEWSPRFLHCTL